MTPVPLLESRWRGVREERGQRRVMEAERRDSLTKTAIAPTTRPTRLGGNL